MIGGGSEKFARKKMRENALSDFEFFLEDIRPSWMIYELTPTSNDFYPLPSLQKSTGLH